jgi:hypothetical protein
LEPDLVQEDVPGGLLGAKAVDIRRAVDLSLARQTLPYPYDREAFQQHLTTRHERPLEYRSA